MESKFLDQDVDVVSLANKVIVIGCFVGGNYNKVYNFSCKLKPSCIKGHGMTLVNIKPIQAYTNEHHL